MKLAALLALVLSGCGCVSVPDYESAAKASLRLEWPNQVCSGTAVGPHTILSAAHCFGVASGSMLVNDVRADYEVIADDQNDHVLVHVSTFQSRVAHLGPKPRQGDVVFTHGNPGGYPDLLIVGYVSGWVDGNMELDSNNWHGDSGAAVFNRWGQIVGVVSQMFPWPNDGWRLTQLNALKFSQEDWRKAERS